MWAFFIHCAEQKNLLLLYFWKNFHYFWIIFYSLSYLPGAPISWKLYLLGRLTTSLIYLVFYLCIFFLISFLWSFFISLSFNWIYFGSPIFNFQEFFLFSICSLFLAFLVLWIQYPLLSLGRYQLYLVGFVCFYLLYFLWIYFFSLLCVLLLWMAFPNIWRFFAICFVKRLNEAY